MLFVTLNSICLMSEIKYCFEMQMRSENVCASILLHSVLYQFFIALLIVGLIGVHLLKKKIKITGLRGERRPAWGGGIFRVAAAALFNCVYFHSRATPARARGTISKGANEQ